ncbi:hypothetical protein DSM104635_02854 [Terricaulis silvestris]|uniref:Uncharacterized protein n=2 Tax=Terricaulis silvestris TaxID=2686094 RepID=A0A6I6MRH9_9CAUL|nr:hypothetical protein DSM104635_02854 [Terricaulis silvestris]
MHRTRFALLAAGCMALAGVAFAQTQTIRPPVLQLPSTVPTPQGVAGEGLYVAGADRVAISGDTLIVGLAAPRGTYQVSARAVIANDREGDGAVACRLTMNGGEIDYSSISVAPHTRQDITLLGVAAATAPIGAHIEMRCRNAGASTATTVRWARVHALIVPRVTGSAPQGNEER